MIEVIKPGLQTTVQDAGRPGYLARGIPPAGPQDYRSFAIASVLAGNAVPPPPLSMGDPREAGLEMLATGPTLRFHDDAVIALTGGEMRATLDGEPVPQWTRLAVPAGAELCCGKIGPGMRGYLAVAGGIDVPRYLGSRATYVRGGQGGLDGRALRKGDRLKVGTPSEAENARRASTAPELRRVLGQPWTVRVVPGPQAHLFTPEALDLFYSATWKLAPTSDRMGFRFIGPQLQMLARPDYLVRDAGSGPADIVDDITPLGGIQVPGGIEPIAMGVENPTAGGYAKIGTVISTDLGVLGQIRPHEDVTFRAVSLEEALAAAEQERQDILDQLGAIA
ncbi:biotin-dependent carboxyltransferase family protein [Streptomyces sp. CA-106131]|uniref:5-oxoprolinase subunit C family protein n=1 Tax=Streptomyces sp. CA-106131 TaxID=3240045 RepID=UPI003D9396B6